MPRAGNVVGGRYELVAEVGQGAMGSVWRAVHVELQRPFAVKFLKPYDDDRDRMQERFRREARLAASVSHRFVVDIVDYGTTNEGTPFLVMQYLEGEALDARLRRDPVVKVRDLVRMMAEVLEGLAAVHRAGIVHRDVKPENILLTVEGDHVVPKLVDFSISREEPLRQQAPGRPTPVPQQGTAMGTPWYMSPEQADGRLPVDRRSDIFSVGVILYEALTGAPPFDGPDVASVVAAVVRGDAAPLPVMRAELGRDLCAIVDRALEREPDQRHQDADSMAAALFATLATIPDELTCPRLPPLEAPPPSVRSRRPVQAFAITDVKRAVLARPRPSRSVVVAPPRGRATRIAVAAGGLLLVLTAALYLGVPRAGARPAPPAPPPRVDIATMAAVTSDRPLADESPAAQVQEPRSPSSERPAPPTPPTARHSPRRQGLPPALFRSPGF